MKLFSRQLSTIYKNQEALSSVVSSVAEYPRLSQFLMVVGVKTQIINVRRIPLSNNFLILLLIISIFHFCLQFPSVFGDHSSAYPAGLVVLKSFS